MIVTPKYQISNLTTIPDLARFIQLSFDDLLSTINGKLEFDINIQSSIVDVSFTSTSVAVAVIHKLGRIPKGYILVQSNTAAIIYDGGSASTTNLIYLKSSAIATVKILFF